MRQASQKTGTFHSQEGYYLRTMQEGVWIPVNLTISRLHVKPKTLALITARDVREQREAHNRLKKMEGEFRRVLASCSDCLWSAEVDEAGQCTFRYFSAMVEKITGHTQDFFQESFHRWWAMIHPEDQPRWEKMFHKLRTGQPAQEVYRMVRKDGSVCWLRDRATATPSTANRSLQLDGVVTDITERKQSEMSVNDWKQRFEVFMTNCPAIAFLKDQTGRLVYWNARFERAMGRRGAELQGKTDFDLFPSEVAWQLRTNDAAVLAGDQPIQTIEAIPGADGVKRRWSVVKFPFEDSAGRRYVGGLALESDADKETAVDNVTLPAEKSDPNLQPLR
jgi:PAS domain S-box-containing protein